MVSDGGSMGFLPDRNGPGSRWVLLDTVTDDTVMQDVNGTDYYFALPQTSAAYNYYMLWIDRKIPALCSCLNFPLHMKGAALALPD